MDVKIVEFVYELIKNGIKIWLEGSKLAIIIVKTILGVYCQKKKDTETKPYLRYLDLAIVPAK